MFWHQGLLSALRIVLEEYAHLIADRGTPVEKMVVEDIVESKHVPPVYNVLMACVNQVRKVLADTHLIWLS